MSRMPPVAGSDVGRVGYLAVGGRLVAVLVVREEGKRLKTAGVDGVERVVSEDRLFWLGERRLDGPDALAGYWQAVRKRAADCDLPAAWELLAAEGQLDETTPAELAALTPGGHAPEDLDGLLVAVFEDALHFKLRKGRIHPASPEALEQTKRRLEEEARVARETEAALAVFAARLEGKDCPARDAGGAAGIDVDAAVRRRLDVLADVAVNGRDSGRVDEAQALLEALRVKRTGDPARRAFELLVKLGEFRPDENLFVRRAGIQSRFAADVAAEAERLAATPWPRERRRDMTGLTTVAIDDARTTEVDDAFAIEGNTLHVLIADAGALVPPGSAVEEEASRRATTLYLPEGKVPMLPAVLAEGAASLDAGVDRPALCFSGEIDRDGRLMAFEVFEAVCRVTRRVTYDEADRILAGDGQPGPIEDLVRQAAHWMDRHRANRARLGALMLQRNEVSITIDDDGRVDVHAVDANGPARQLVSEMMVAVGVATANWCRDQQVPCIYRAQAPPDVLPEALGEEVRDPIEQVAILRRLKPTVLTTRALPHFTLGVEAYTQVTSPIRRYQDLLMHHQMKAFLRTGRPMLSDGKLMEVFDEVERQTALRRRVEQDSRRFWTLRFLEQNRDRTWDAVVVRELARRWLVEIGELVLQTPFTPQGHLQLGDRLRLRVAEVDARWDHLVLVEAPS